MVKELEPIDSTVVLENPYWQYRQDHYHLPTGEVGTYYYAHTPGSVMVIPRTASGHIVLVRQYRYLNRRRSLEFPGGGVRATTPPETAARAELQEEAGLTCTQLTPLGTFNPCNGLTDETCSVFLAEGLSDGVASPDPGEEFEILTVEPHEFEQLVRRGEVWDGMTLAAWSLFRILHQPDLS